MNKQKPLESDDELDDDMELEDIDFTQIIPHKTKVPGDEEIDEEKDEEVMNQYFFKITDDI